MSELSRVMTAASCLSTGEFSLKEAVLFCGHEKDHSVYFEALIFLQWISDTEEEKEECYDAICEMLDFCGIEEPTDEESKKAMEAFTEKYGLKE